MKIYLASIYGKHMLEGQTGYARMADREQEIIRGVENHLESYHYIGSKKAVDVLRKIKSKVFLDSGAFSSHMLGIEINLNQYCEYILKNEDIIKREDNILMASVLDGIGDAQLTYENQMKMEALGVKPLPCFHAGEDERYLEWYIKNYEYITLGGLVGSSTKSLMMWLDRIFNKYICDGSGNPKIKVHGFGITSLPIMETYPWWSVDSSSWIQFARFGNIFHAEKGIISLSDQSPSKKNEGKHLENFSEIERNFLLKEFEKEGFEFERLNKFFESRASYNALSFKKINDRINSEKNFQGIQRQELF